MVEIPSEIPLGSQKDAFSLVFSSAERIYPPTLSMQETGKTQNNCVRSSALPIHPAQLHLQAIYYNRYRTRDYSSLASTPGTEGKTSKSCNSKPLKPFATGSCLTLPHRETCTSHLCRMVPWCPNCSMSPAARVKQAQACCSAEKACKQAKALLNGHQHHHETEAVPAAYFFSVSTDGTKL